MTFGNHAVIVAFLEKDNVKLLSYISKGKTVQRQFAGQISLGQDVLKDAFIADPIKFSSQVKIALAQNPSLTPIIEVILFMPPDKTFVKALPATDAIDSFIRTLPYFKEELIINSPSTTNSRLQATDLITHTAFERKLIEDFQRPFLESGKKVTTVESSVVTLAKKYANPGKYFLLIPYEKDTAVALCDNGEVLEMTSFPKDATAGRLVEFIAGKNLKDITTAFTVGIFPPDLIEKIKANASLTVNQLAQKDIYDLTVESRSNTSKNISFSLKLPNQKILFLAGAIIVGFILVILIIKNIPQKSTSIAPKPTATPIQTPVPTPEPKPSDYKITVLNGTLVTGEAGRLGDKLKGLGFELGDTKNATNSAFTDTKLIVGPNTPSKITDAIKLALQDSYATITTDPTATSSTTLTVIIGKKK